MAGIDAIKLDVKVVIGSTTMPLVQFLQLGRGGVIRLDTPQEVAGDDSRLSGDPSLLIEVNGKVLAHARVVLNGEDVAVEILDAA